MADMKMITAGVSKYCTLFWIRHLSRLNIVHKTQSRLLRSYPIRILSFVDAGIGSCSLHFVKGQQRAQIAQATQELGALEIGPVAVSVVVQMMLVHHQEVTEAPLG